MSERALSEAAMLAGLRDIRLPTEAAGGAVADIAMAVALGGAAALIAGAIIRMFSQRRVGSTPANVAQRLAALADQPDSTRRVALLHLLKSEAPERFGALRPRLYRQDGNLSVSQLEQEVRRHVRTD